MSAKRPITFGDILDLLDRDSTEVTLCYDDDNITGAASSKLWALAEDKLVLNMSPSEDGLDVWLKKEDGNEPEKSR